MESRTDANFSWRKFSPGILAAAQSVDDVRYFVKGDCRMPRSRLRRYLSQYGMRGEALHAEVIRIVAGPQKVSVTTDTRIHDTGPYGWEPADYTPMMRRIFRGKQTRHLVMFDELSLVCHRNGEKL